MPRSKVSPDKFIAGPLPKITFNDKEYYVDGRMQQIREVNNFFETVSHYDITKKQDIKIINFEFYGKY